MVVSTLAQAATREYRQRRQEAENQAAQRAAEEAALANTPIRETVPARPEAAVAH
jgi:hypothetical protein